MKLRSLLLATAMLMSVAAMADTEVIAHRGYWKTAGSAQNSLTSLRKANQIGCYGSECDVWISTDGTIFVNHDRKFKGVEIQKSTAKECKAVILDNGEHMPTLKQYLKVAKKQPGQLIIEIKTHKDPARLTACIDGTLKLVKKAKMEQKVTYIAFSYDATLQLIKKAPKGTEVYYLNGDKSPQELKAIGCAGPDYEQKVFMQKHPEWFDEFHKLGMKINVWTVDDPQVIEYYVKRGADYITTNVPELVQKTIKDNK
ncbi:MAG: glycerophosphodiester phosphodiesterase family protein [Prevotellaceae bacterium]|jgi:glycerophosphoryl diester phosphodiesterase|nr:glycerophosphodiester phosphodiesterase family protein [Prevotellaceae bacterium]MDY3856963.1 glycerophosphodiester phosphodiesterase family protein [Bacteroidaceae bacterium]